MKLNKLQQEYYLSFDFNNLRNETKAQYKYFLDVAMTTDVGTTQTLGSIDLSKITCFRPFFPIWPKYRETKFI